MIVILKRLYKGLYKGHCKFVIGILHCESIIGNLHLTAARACRGYGVFAKERIGRGAFVVEYAGEVITEVQRLERLMAARASGTIHFYIMELSKGLYIDAGERGSNARFINSSCDPNCETQKWKDAATGARICPSVCSVYVRLCAVHMYVRMHLSVHALRDATARRRSRRTRLRVRASVHLRVGTFTLQGSQLQNNVSLNQTCETKENTHHTKHPTSRPATLKTRALNTQNRGKTAQNHGITEARVQARRASASSRCATSLRARSSRTTTTFSTLACRRRRRATAVCAVRPTAAERWTQTRSARETWGAAFASSGTTMTPTTRATSCATTPTQVPFCCSVTFWCVLF